MILTNLQVFTFSTSLLFPNHTEKFNYNIKIQGLGEKYKKKQVGVELL
jgi:hypothetical protein